MGLKFGEKITASRLTNNDYLVLIKRVYFNDFIRHMTKYKAWLAEKLERKKLKSKSRMSSIFFAKLERNLYDKNLRNH